MVHVHIVMGLLALLAGFVALFSRKGGNLHRRSGLLFVAAMIVMLGTGAILALFVVDEPENGVGALFTIYLVVTSLLTVTRRVEEVRRITMALAGLAFGLGLAALLLGAALFAPVMIGCGIADLRLLKQGTIAGNRRLARHLWRMTFALWIATASFFLGQAKVLPEPLQNIWLLSVPVLAVLATLVYWLVRVSRKKSRAIGGATGGVPWTT
ncbi:MAG TPA: hypothetical protein VFR77_03265 [Steroidobacteraceae bacterium]|nr:hypothetical protein [Steroidobacteraceae bacterium]